MQWGYNLEIWQKSEIAVSINLDLKTYCHALIVGASGSGKSYSMLFLLKQLLHENIILYFLDPKNSEDFKFMQNYEHYYSADDCYRGFKDFYDIFTQARKTIKADRRYVLVCDEYPAFILQLRAQDSLNKTKCASEILSINSELLMLGRGVGKGFGVFTVCQRAMASVFAEGSRDNYMITISLGRLSEEQRKMLFTDISIREERIYGKGEGILLADGKQLMEVKFPYIRNIESWKQQILESL